VSCSTISEVFEEKELKLMSDVEKTQTDVIESVRVEYVIVNRYSLHLY
jgi:hypothetical protein